MVREEVDSVTSIFVLDLRKPNENNQKFIDDQTKRGFRFKYAKGMKGKVSGGNYCRFGQSVVQSVERIAQMR